MHMDVVQAKRWSYLPQSGGEDRPIGLAEQAGASTLSPQREETHTFWRRTHTVLHGIEHQG